MTTQELKARTQAYIKALGLSIYKINQGQQPNPLPFKMVGKDGETAKHILGIRCIVNAHRGKPLTEGQRLILSAFFNELDSKN